MIDSQSEVWSFWLHPCALCNRGPILALQTGGESPWSGAWAVSIQSKGWDKINFAVQVSYLCVQYSSFRGMKLRVCGHTRRLVVDVSDSDLFYTLLFPSCVSF